MQVGGESIGQSSSYGPAALDTGTALFVLPSDLYSALTAKVEASAGYQEIFGTTKPLFSSDGFCWPFPAATASRIDASLPHLTLKLGIGGGLSLDLPPTSSYIVPITYHGRTLYCAGSSTGRASKKSVIERTLCGREIEVSRRARGSGVI